MSQNDEMDPNDYRYQRTVLLYALMFGGSLLTLPEYGLHNYHIFSSRIRCSDRDTLDFLQNVDGEALCDAVDTVSGDIDSVWYANDTFDETASEGHNLIVEFAYQDQKYTWAVALESVAQLMKHLETLTEMTLDDGLDAIAKRIRPEIGLTIRHEWRGVTLVLPLFDHEYPNDMATHYPAQILREEDAASQGFAKILNL